MTALALALVLAQFEPPPLRILDEGAARGSAGTVNCTGVGVTCSVSGSRATLSVSASAPGGSAGDLQVNSAGALGGYAGAGPCLSGQYFTALTSAGGASCSAPGASNQVIYNLSGALTSDANLTWNGASLGIGNPNILPNNPLAVRGDGDVWYQVNIQNTNAGVNASSDYVATANTGSDLGDYIDMGINSSGYANPDYSIGGPLTGYLMTVGGDLTIGTGTEAKVIKLHTGGTTIDELRLTLTDATLDLAPGVALQFSGEPGTATQVLHGSATGQQTWGAVDLAADVTGALPVTQIADDAASGLCLLSGGTGDPMWMTCPGGGGGGVPVGMDGEIQIKASADTFGAYAGSSCSAGQAPLGLTSAGAVTGCFTPPGTYSLPDATSSVTGGLRLTGDLGGTATSPAVVDDSHAHTTTTISGLDAGDITTGALAGARGGVGLALPTCSGTDKLTADGTQVSCATDQGGSYTLPAATSTVLGGVKGTGTALVCSGTDKATGFAADGTLQCAADQGGSGSGLTLPQILVATRNSFGGF